MSPKIETQKELTAENQSVSSFLGAPGGNRTRTAVSGQGILSPSCLPFHHQGMGGRSAKGAERTAKIRNNSDNENVGRRYKARLYNKTVPQSRFAVHVSPKPGGMG